jgi:hypothetical protein
MVADATQPEQCPYEIRWRDAAPVNPPAGWFINANNDLDGTKSTTTR